jgi:hypothetical protein
MQTGRRVYKLYQKPFFKNIYLEQISSYHTVQDLKIFSKFLPKYSTIKVQEAL